MKGQLIGAAMIGLMLLAGACGSKEKKNESGETQIENLSFESFRFERIGEYEDSDSLASDGEKYVRYISEGVLPRDLGTGGAGLLRDSLMRMAWIVTDEEGLPAPRMQEGIVRGYSIPDSVINCSFIYSSMSTTLLTPRVVVWEVERETYAYHAAHANRFMGFVNYNLTTGKILSLSDLMKPGYEAPLAEMVRTKLAEDSVELLVDPKEIELPQSFAITTDGILFSFNPYQIAPYSEGIIKVELSLDEIFDYLSKEGLIILEGNAD